MLSSLQQSRLFFFFIIYYIIIGTFAGIADYLGRDFFFFFSFIGLRPTLQSICVILHTYVPEFLHACLLMAEGPIDKRIYAGEVRVNGRKQLNRHSSRKLSLEVVVDFYNYSAVNFPTT